MIFAPVALAAHVVLWHSYHSDEQQGLEAAVAVWNRAHPDETVEPLAVPVEGFAQKLESAIPHGHGPDLFITAHEHVGDWSREGLVAPLDESKLDEAALLPGLIEPLRVDGKLYGVPLSFKSAVLYYRTDLVPAPPRDTDELLRMCKDFKARGKFCLVYEAGSFYYHAAFLHGFGGHILRGDRSDLASNEGVAALQFVRTLVEKGYIPDETTGTLVGELFNDGRAAFALSGPWFLGDLRPGVPFAIAPLPTVSATGKRCAPLLTVEAAMLSPRATQPAAALAFARWLAGPEGAHVRATVGHQTVSDRATWDDPAIAHDPRLAAFRQQLDATVPMPNAPVMAVTWEPAQQALRRVLRGADDPQTALREADRRVEIAMRPRPPDGTPWPIVILGGLSLAGALWLWRRRGAPLEPLERARGRSAYGYLAPAGLAMLVLVFIPFAVCVGMAFCDNEGSSWRYVGVAHFGDILLARDYPITDPLSFYFTLVVTALWTVANVTLHVAIGVTLALLLRDPLLKLRGVYRVLLIVPWAVPNYITALLWKGMFHRQFGAINALLGLVGIQPISWWSRFSTAFCANLTTNVWLGFPFMMVVTLGALSRIPKDLEEAAALDGATRWQRLRQVVLPLLKPALLPSVILGAVWTFNQFNVVFLVSGGEPDGASSILITQAYDWAFKRGHRYGYAAAYAVLIFLVLVAQSVIARRAAPATEDA